MPPESVPFWTKELVWSLRWIFGFLALWRWFLLFWVGLWFRFIFAKTTRVLTRFRVTFGPKTNLDSERDTVKDRGRGSGPERLHRCNYALVYLREKIRKKMSD